MYGGFRLIRTVFGKGFKCQGRISTCGWILGFISIFVDRMTSCPTHWIFFISGR